VNAQSLFGSSTAMSLRVRPIGNKWASPRAAKLSDFRDALGIK